MEPPNNRRSHVKVTFRRDPEIKPGQDLKHEILQAAASASVLMVVVSKQWLDSPHCQEELAAFRGIAVISVLTLDVRASRPKELRRYQWEEFFSV
jgi:hypothetical protein